MGKDNRNKPFTAAQWARVKRLTGGNLRGGVERGLVDQKEPARQRHLYVLVTLGVAFTFFVLLVLGQSHGLVPSWLVLLLSLGVLGLLVWGMWRAQSWSRAAEIAAVIGAFALVSGAVALIYEAVDRNAQLANPEVSGGAVRVALCSAPGSSGDSPECGTGSGNPVGQILALHNAGRDTVELLPDAEAWQVPQSGDVRLPPWHVAHFGASGVELHTNEPIVLPGGETRFILVETGYFNALPRFLVSGGNSVEVQIGGCELGGSFRMVMEAVAIGWAADQGYDLFTVSAIAESSDTPLEICRL